MASILLCVFFIFFNLVSCNFREYCVIGAGPSGLQMGYFLKKANRDYIIFERDSSPGWFFKIYPRHRKLISINKRWTGKTNKEFNLRHDWNSLLSDNDSLLFTKYSKDFFPHADTLVKYLKDYAETLKLKVQYNTYIVDVSKNDNKYILKDKKGGVYACKYLIISTGIWVENIPSKAKGFEHTVGYPTMSIDPDEYEGQSILIVGRGNSAFETAQHLQGATNLIHLVSRNRVRFSWETHYVGDVRAVNDNAIDTYQLKSLDGQLEADMSSWQLKKENSKIHIMFQSSNISEFVVPGDLATRQTYDTVIRCTGFKFDRSIFNKDVRPKVYAPKTKFPEITPLYESTVSKNMYFTGVATHSIDFRKSAGGFIHGFRYTVRALHHILEWRNHGVRWPSIVLPLKDLMNFLIKRINEGSGIYQMTSSFCDVIVFRENKFFEYFEDLPIGILSEFEKHTGKSFEKGIVVRLEYGRNFSGPGSDPFREDRATGEAQQAHKSNFLHPVLYYYEGMIPEPVEHVLVNPKRLHHMVEDFLAEWIDPTQHLLPLRWFLEYCTGTDLRQFYAESCFEYVMTSTVAPLFCQEEYLKGFGLAESVFIGQ